MGPDVHGREVGAARPLRDRADPILAAILFALFARTFLFQAFAVPSPSMEKTVLTGDRVLINRFLYGPRGGPLSVLMPSRPPRRGDVVVFRFPADPRRDFIKRIIALPGERIAIRNREVLVDGRPLSEPYAFHADDRVWPDDPAISEEHRRRDQLAERAVPSGAYFVLGDNRDDSSDSRSWGPVPASHVEGRAVLVYWSLPPRASDAPSGGTSVFARPFEILSRTRWSRSFLPVR